MTYAWIKAATSPAVAGRTCAGEDDAERDGQKETGVEKEGKG